MKLLLFQILSHIKASLKNNYCPQGAHLYWSGKHSLEVEGVPYLELIGLKLWPDM